MICPTEKLFNLVTLSDMGSVPASLGCQFGFSTVCFKPKLINPLVNRGCFVFSPQPSTYKANFSKLRVEARNPTKTESAKVRNRRMRKKFNGTHTKPRLSVFCSNHQLYAMLVDDQNKKILFYASTLQKSISEDPSCTIMEAAQRVGEALVQACKELNITEISSNDRNGFARGESMMAFEIAISEYGFLPR
ncbi:50S ribosomal L18-like protein [Rhynchospora pubera]|uniref:50S ribosomal L18-like protein n=1 Tax=Rhynchospora pubera TaxID=906938 RepID=A0AAV8DHU9_9POAL|nr:50S ribosomal L18-like protein [Rhynchospora pubera]